MINTKSPSPSSPSSWTTHTTRPESSSRAARSPEYDSARQDPPAEPSRKRWRGGETSTRQWVERTFASSPRRKSDGSPAPADELRAEKRQRIERAAAWKEHHADRDASGPAKASSSGRTEERDSWRRPRAQEQDAAQGRGRMLAGMRRKRENDRDAGRNSKRPQPAAPHSGRPASRLLRNQGRPAQQEQTASQLVHSAFHRKRDFGAPDLYGSSEYARLLEISVEGLKSVALKLYANVLSGAMTQLPLMKRTMLAQEEIEERIALTREALTKVAERCLARPWEFLDSSDWQMTATFCNAFSKVEEDGPCRQACSYVAACFQKMPDKQTRDSLLDDAAAQNLSMLANAFSKFLHDPSCSEALTHLAGYVTDAPKHRVDEFDNQGLSNLANAFSKLPENDSCRKALGAVAAEVSERGKDGMDRFNEQDVSNLANAFGKLPEDDSCRTALIALAVEATARAGKGGMDRFDEQHLSNLANAFGKLTENDSCRKALIALAAEVSERAGKGGMGRFNEQELSNLANTFGKLPEDDSCRKALIALAVEVNKRAGKGRMGRFNEHEATARASKSRIARCSEQHLSNLANAFGKLTENDSCRKALSAVAAEVNKRGTGGMDRFKDQELSNLANAFSKLPEDAGCRTALAALAVEVSERASKGRIAHCSEQQLSTLANAFGKLPESDSCRKALSAVAAEVNKRGKGGMRRFDEQGLANLANAFSKLPEDGFCRTALTALAAEVKERGKGGMGRFNDQGLANLANAFSKLPEDDGCRTALAALAVEVRESASKGRIAHCSEQHLSTLANAFGKLPENDSCRKALGAVAAEVSERPGKGGMGRFNEQDLSNLANAFRKLPEDTGCRKALIALAAEVSERAGKGRMGRFDEQGLSTLANAFGKLPEDAGCRTALAALAVEVTKHSASDNRMGRFNKHVATLCASKSRIVCFDEQGLSNLANAFGKLPENGACRTALSAVAAEVSERAGKDGMSRFNEQHLSNLANAFRKLPEDAGCRKALSAVAAEVKERGKGGMGRFDEQGLANLANAFSKLPEDGSCRAALTALAAEVNKRGRGGMGQFKGQHLSNLANAFSKLPEDGSCRTALTALAAEVSERAGKGGMGRFNEQELSNLANAFGKLPETESCRTALIALAAEVSERASKGRMGRFNEQDLSTLANAFSKLPEDDSCRTTQTALAAEVNKRGKDGMDKFTEQGLATLANAFSKLSTPECRAANLLIARHLMASPARLDAAPIQSLAMWAHAFSRQLHGTDEEAQATLEKALCALAPPAAKRIPEAGVIAIANLLRAYGRARLTKEMGALTEPALPRITALLAADGLRGDDLEAAGALCAGLTPLVRSEDLRRFRRDALHLLQQLRPVVTRKLDLYLAQQGSDAAPPDEACSTRCPALSAYQILKAYVQVRSHWQGREVDMSNKQAAAGAADLDAWLKDVYARTTSLIERDLSSYSWNMIAQLESEDPTEALDRFVIEHSEQIARLHKPTTFDHDSVFDSFDHEPRTPAAGTGLLSIPTVDMQGKVLRTGQPQYSLFARLTQSKIQPLWVQLPERFSSFLLARTLMHEGKPYRFDLVGGSRMKAGRRDIAQIFAPGESKPSPGMLLALPAAETLPGSAYGRMMAEMFPNEESFYYFQRALVGSPPNLAKDDRVGAASASVSASASASAQDVAPAPPMHVLEGRFRIALLPDTRPAGEAAHPFAMTDEHGQPIALRPFDGCGFIREGLAMRMPAYARALHYGRETESANLPAQALQHYLRNEAVADEVAGRMIERLQAQGTPPTPEQLFRSMSAGLIKGDIGVAVPSSDGRVHLPQAKSGAFGRHGGDLLLGKSPYDKPNLGRFAHDQVRADGPTARFLDRCTTLQYSFWIKSDSAGDDPVKAFAKGLLVAVPDDLWPAAFSDVDMCLSAEDVKMQSDWHDGKKRTASDLRLAGTGQLQAGELFAGGSLVAVPPQAQQKRDGDFDGDPLLILAGYPRLTEDVRRYNELEEALALPSLKPPKSHTPAVGPDGQYRHGRAAAIMSMQLNVLTDFVGLQYLYLAQPREERRRFAEQALFGVLDGWEPSREDSKGNWQPGLRPLVGRMLDAQTPEDKRAALEKAAAMLRHQHDSARHPQARQAAALLADAVRAWAAEQLPGQPLPELDLPVPAADPAFERLFPGLQAQLDAQPAPKQRIDALLRRVPNGVPMPGQHWQVEGDAEASVNRLLAMGVKIGTDALKSNTGTRQARRTADYLTGLYNRMYGGRTPPPYTKLLARQIRAGNFNAQAALEQLTDNPTLAAEIMEKAIARLEKKGWLPQPDGARAGKPAQPGSVKRMTEYRFDKMLPNSRSWRELDKVSYALRERAFTLEKAVTPVLADLLESLGGREHKPKGKSPDRLKSDWSIKDKIARAYQGRCQDVTQAQADACVKDALRYAIVFDQAGFTGKTLQALEQLGARFDIERVKNNFAEDAVYKDINVKLRDRDSGARFEIQFHTDASIDAKVDTHDLYRRSLNPHLSRKDREDLQQQMRKRSGPVALPDGVERIAEKPKPAGPVRPLELRRMADGKRPAEALRPAEHAATPSPTAGDTGIAHTLRTRFQEMRHTDTGIRAKGETRALERRSLDPRLEREEGERLLQRMRQRSGTAALPDGVERIAEEPASAGPGRSPLRTTTGAGIAHALRDRFKETQGAAAQPRGRQGETEPSP